MKRFLFTCSLLAIFCLLHSCILSKKMVYVKDMVADSAYLAMSTPVLKLQKGDRLNIVVSAKSPELAAPFNLEVGSYTVNEKGEVDRRTSSYEKSYLVDDNGQIDFPILGRLDVLGLSLEQVKDVITNHIVNQQLISEPIVRVDLQNFKINVMGEVRRIGLIEVPDGKITILDALSEAGGLTLNGAPHKVVVIREENGQRTLVYNDLESTDIFTSPTFYLQQNDIVYVQPKGAEATPREQLGFRYASLGFSLLSVILTTIALLK